MRDILLVVAACAALIACAPLKECHWIMTFS
jgi:hypothetical protein